ncbi:MAG: hypothetical protein V4507_08890 [Verrucomicrobiota bacterium]
MNRLSLSLLIGMGLLSSAVAEEKTTTSSEGKPQDKEWLQTYIKEQQKLQENQRADADSKVNPFKAIEKPNPEKPKDPEKFNLLTNKEKESPKAPAKIESPRSLPTDTTFKPSISGFTQDSFYQQRREIQSRSAVEQMESGGKKDEENDLKKDDLLEKMRRERLQQNLNSPSNDKAFGRDITMPNDLNHPNLDEDHKNPYLNQNQSIREMDRDKFGSETANRLPTIQMIKPIETPQMLENPSLNRSVFENQNNRQQNTGSIYNQMMLTPGTGKNRVQDPNDFLKR